MTATERALEGRKVLLVEDDPATVELVSLGLRYEGATLDVASDGLEALRNYAELDPDLVLLDLMLPGLEGFRVLEQIRSRGSTPVILLTARNALEDRVRGLEAGGDDYVVKPFSFDELLARIRAVLRRYGHAAPSDEIAIADLAIDLAGHDVYRAGKRIQLTPREFDVLVLLAENAGRVLSKEQIFERVWGSDHYGDLNVVEQHISRVRTKLGDTQEKPLVHTVRGVGYVLRVDG